MPVHDDLGLRMKTFYEQIPKTKLMRRTPVAIRIDGKAFHTFTRGFQKPFDEVLIKTMQETMKYLCENIQGCVLGHNEMKNIDIVKLICKELGKPESLITHVTDRKGHDMRYAIDPTKIHNELGWLPETKFADGIKKTIKWYLENREWWETIISGEYQNYYEKMYGGR